MLIKCKQCTNKINCLFSDISLFENVPENLVHLNYVTNVPDSWYKLGTKSAPLILSDFSNQIQF